MGVLSTLAQPLQPVLLELSALPTPLYVLILGSAILVFAVVANVLQQILLRDPKKPPVVFHYFPWIGSTVAYGMDPYRFFGDNQKKYGDVFTYVMLGRNMTVCLGPHGNEMVFNAKLSEVSAEEVYTNLTTPVFGEGVVYDCPNHRLMEQKKFMKFGLTTETFRSYVPLIVEQVEDYIKKSPFFKGPKGTASLSKIIPEITIFTASRTLQGKEVRDALNGSFAADLHDLDMGFNPMNFLMPGIPTPGNRRRDIAQRKMARFYMDVIQRRREDPEQSKDKSDMVWNLMDRKYKDGTPVTDRDVAHMMIALLMAGQHTSMATTMWIILHLAHQPKLLEQLWQEQLSVLGNPPRPLAYEDLSRLPLHNNVIKEVLRLHPPLHSIMRKVKSPLVVRGTPYTIPSTHYVLAAPGASARDSRYFKNPSIFDPSRWETQTNGAADENEEMHDFGFGMISKGTQSPYLPFGAGRHRCIGEQFANVQLGTILATWVRLFEMELPGEFPEVDYTSMIAMAKAPAEVVWRKRDY
ncbi:lanosterol 14-alpha-demethylase [Ascodesmis nigricans]|uniref:Lanosterol 14-alpha-demethylase n=1 Tax=Ascodesmis nigricans TaxID=341454 RepID=A0A4S2MP43_9PEZI|nr:lanosterol 14-alpha-demethylase [Ascodesmis nigricans]